MIRSKQLYSGSILFIDELESVDGEVEVWFDPQMNMSGFEVFSGNSCVTDNISDDDRKTILQAMQDDVDQKNKAYSAFLKLVRDRDEAAREDT